MSLGRRALPLCLLPLAQALRASAATFPERPVRWIVESPPGSNSDILARSLGAGLAQGWGQPVVVDNRPGANGSIAYSMAARAAADGHTLISIVNTLPLNIVTRGDLTYRGEDFAPLAVFFTAPNAVLVPASSGARTLAEWIAQARGLRQGVSYGVPGTNSSPHVTGEILMRRGQYQGVHIPYPGSAQVLQELLAGRIDMGIVNVPAATALVQNGSLRMLAMTGSDRHPGFEDVPTMAQAGVGPLVVQAWFGVAMQRTVPEATQLALHAEITRLLRTPEMTGRLRGMGAQVQARSLAEVQAFYTGEIGVWRQLVAESQLEFTR